MQAILDFIDAVFETLIRFDVHKYLIGFLSGILIVRYAHRLKKAHDRDQATARGEGEAADAENIKQQLTAEIDDNFVMLKQWEHHAWLAGPNFSTVIWDTHQPVLHKVLNKLEHRLVSRIYRGLDEVSSFPGIPPDITSIIIDRRKLVAKILEKCNPLKAKKKPRK